MSKATDEQQARLERARKIGLFRYMLIREAADATLTARQRGALVRKLAAGPHTDPDGRTVRITRWTLDRWILNYREGGFDALVPSPRQSQPRTPPEVFELAAALKKENPSRSAAQVRRILHAQLGWAPDETTLQRMFVRTGLTALRAPAEPAVFGRFEAGQPNEIWTGDALHGPRIGGRKTYLFAFLDDHSRAITGHRWGFAEDTVRLAAALRPALAARGVPEYVYVDNGSAFVDSWLLRACGRWRAGWKAAPTRFPRRPTWPRRSAGPSTAPSPKPPSSRCTATVTRSTPGWPGGRSSSSSTRST
jgi:putative transposase